MRGGATSGKSFNEGCEGGVPEELEVDLREGWVDCSADSGDWSSFVLLVTEGVDGSGAFLLIVLVRRAGLEGIASGSTMRTLESLELESCRPCSSCETLPRVAAVDVGGHTGPPLSDREKELGRGSVGDDMDALCCSPRDATPLDDGG